MKNSTALDRADADFGSHFAGFHTLMPYRAQEILLVSSLYESFILEEDGLLTDMIQSEYLEMNLSHAPRVTHVTTGEEALDILRDRFVDVVITTTRLSRWDVREFADAVKEACPDTAVMVLADEPHELARYGPHADRGPIDLVLVWTGDAKILLAGIKLIEDKMNVEHDILAGSVRVIILVENSVRFYSAFIPAIYTEIMRLVQLLMAEGLNHTHRLMRQRARPKILLAETYEQGLELYERYSANVLGVISDVRFSRNGKHDPMAGIELIRHIRADSPYLPILLQSSEPSYASAAKELNAGFIYKKSATLLEELRQFLLNNFGFGEFVFTDGKGHELGRAGDLNSFAEEIARVPAESIQFHARNNHFSNWLMARSEFALAAQLRPKRVSDFESIEDVRRFLLESFEDYRASSHASVISEYTGGMLSPEARFVRIGGGSIGGKARGLAFIRALLRRSNLTKRFSNVHIAVPRSAAIGIEYFHIFMDENKLRDFVGTDSDNDTIRKTFLDAELPERLKNVLRAYLTWVRYPLAVRSSGLLEDLQDQPSSGIYSTYFLPNDDEDLEPRFEEVCRAIKLVYASAHLREAKQYLESAGHRTEEEHMGVILQEIVGSRHGDRHYPTFSGVVRSYNFYPIGVMEPEDGVANVALGFGKTVVEGGESLMFSPGHPHILPQFPTSREMLSNSQRTFYALDMTQGLSEFSSEADGHLIRAALDVAEKDGALHYVGSVYSPENDMVYDGLHRPGPRLVTFAHILKSDTIPLAEILRTLLEIGQRGMGCPVEIEFAADMDAQPMNFGVLQVRPITTDREFEEVTLEHVSPDRALCYSQEAMGNGRVRNIFDIVYVRPDTFDAAKTIEIAEEIKKFNAALKREDRRYILIGPGRWGSSNSWLGIPIRWEYISQVKIIVETSLQDFAPAPSQGTHLFQNLTASRVSYLTVNPTSKHGFVDWSWLEAQPVTAESDFVRLVRLPSPVRADLDGRSRRGAIYKPGE